MRYDPTEDGNQDINRKFHGCFVVHEGQMVQFYESRGTDPFDFVVATYDDGWNHHIHIKPKEFFDQYQPIRTGYFQIGNQVVLLTKRARKTYMVGCGPDTHMFETVSHELMEAYKFRIKPHFHPDILSVMYGLEPETDQDVPKDERVARVVGGEKLAQKLSSDFCIALDRNYRRPVLLLQGQVVGVWTDRTDRLSLFREVEYMAPALKKIGVFRHEVI